MSHKSPFSPWVAEEWDKLVLDKGARLSAEEREQGWRALYSKTFVNERWVVKIEDAGLVTQCGWAILMQERSFEEARDLARQYLAIPGVATSPSSDGVTYHTVVINEAIADALCGNWDAAFDRIRQKLEIGINEGGSLSSMDLYHVRLMMGSLIQDLGPANKPSAAVSSFTRYVVSFFEGMKRKANAALSAPQNSDLLELLGQTFGRKPVRPRRHPELTPRTSAP